EAGGSRESDHFRIIEKRDNHKVGIGDRGANPRDVDAAVGNGDMLLIPFDADGVYGGRWMLLGELLHDIGDDDAWPEADSEGACSAAGRLDTAAGRGRAGEEH